MKYPTSLSPKQKADYESSSDPVEDLFYDILDNCAFPWMDEVTADFYNHIWDNCHSTQKDGDVEIAQSGVYTSPKNEKKLYKLAESTKKKIVSILTNYKDLSAILKKAGYSSKNEQRGIIAECVDSAWEDIVGDDGGMYHIGNYIQN